jgi:integrase
VATAVVNCDLYRAACFGTARTHLGGHRSQARCADGEARADRYNTLGEPKSKAGERSIPLGPEVLNTLREWKLACPKGADGLVFPTRQGTIQHHSSLVWGLTDAAIRARLVDAEGKPKYTGLHALRHFYASWCINRKADGGLELPAKLVQARLGHASIVMTMDRYGHLFPNDDDGSELAAAERALLI